MSQVGKLTVSTATALSSRSAPGGSSPFPTLEEEEEDGEGNVITLKGGEGVCKVEDDQREECREAGQWAWKDWPW